MGLMNAIGAVPPALLVAIAAVSGLIIGSFLNVVIHRLPEMMRREWRADCAELAGQTPAVEARYDLASPRSSCPHCGHCIGVLENIPLLSWLALRGRCSACHAPIGIRYPLVELLTAALFALSVIHFGPGFAALAAMGLLAALIALSFIDLDTGYLPDRITQPLIWAGVLVNLGDTFTTLSSSVLGATAGYLSLWSLCWAYRQATGKEGIGQGDFKLLAALGAWMGWQMLTFIVLVSSVVGSIAGVAIIVATRAGRDLRIPFGPYLAIAGVLALFAGHALTDWYLGFYPG
jgi:leader peptidase (prepilin peptidase)/N-methyltransferase